MSEGRVTPHLPAFSVVQESHKLTSLPSEMLVRIFTCLDPYSLISVRATCCRFRQLMSDPICWPTSLSWKGSNRIKDVNRLKLVLQLSKSTLKQFSLSCLGYRYPLSKYVDRIQSCRCLESISLINVDCSKAQVEKFLRIPSLTYLHVDLTEKLKDVGVLFETIAVSGCRLKTLSLKDAYPLYCLQYIETWAKLQCNPPNLRLSTIDMIISYQYIHTILALRPSMKDNACLSLYEFATESFSPIHPLLQFDFAPTPSLPLMHLGSKSSPIVLTSDEPGSNQFSCALFNMCCWGIEGKFEFANVSHSLTAIIFRDLNVSSSTLEMAAELCPNLLHLDLYHSSDVLSNLKGLNAVATCCPKLRVLNLCRSGVNRAEVGSLDELWEILKSISSLRVLSVPVYLVCKQSDPISMPKLTNLHINGYHGDRCIDSAFIFLTQMLSLRVFKCECLPPVSLCHGISKFLYASPNLTHLYLDKELGNKLTLPTDPSCYRHLQKFLLECYDFIIHENLASALAQSKDLSVLVFRVDSVAIKGIVELTNSLKALSLFHIYTISNSGFHKPRKTESSTRVSAFAKSLRETAKREGRIVDLKINVNQQFARLNCPELFRWFP